MPAKPKIEKMASDLNFEVSRARSLLRMVAKAHEPEGTTESDDVLYCMEVADRILDGIQDRLCEIEEAAKAKDSKPPASEPPEVTH